MAKLHIQMLIFELAKEKEKFVSQKEMISKKPWMKWMVRKSWASVFKSQSLLTMVPVVVADEAVVAHAVEVLQDAVVANAHTEHNTLLLLKIFPAVAIGHS